MVPPARRAIQRTPPEVVRPPDPRVSTRECSPRSAYRATRIRGCARQAIATFAIDTRLHLGVWCERRLWLSSTAAHGAPTRARPNAPPRTDAHELATLARSLPGANRSTSRDARADARTAALLASRTSRPWRDAVSRLGARVRSTSLERGAGARRPLGRARCAGPETRRARRARVRVTSRARRAASRSAGVILLTGVHSRRRRADA